MRQQIRFFALGLLTASILLFVFYMMMDDSEAQVENLSSEALIAQVEADGYRVITEEEFIDYSFYVDERNKEETEDPSDEENENNENNEQNEREDEQNREEEDDEEEEETTLSLTVSQGDVSQDIASALEENDIIDDAFEFAQYLEENDYSPYLQLGTFDVSSEMSLQEIAETITTFPGN